MSIFSATANCEENRGQPKCAPLDLPSKTAAVTVALPKIDTTVDPLSNRHRTGNEPLPEPPLTQEDENQNDSNQASELKNITTLFLTV